ncbi:hypothetical protein FVE85_3615 [Porphyridium purpureum]|uniref:Uncharacterized protein n=1 Tax=Porphyridium purpureum TaxID=35688 RepID=A0A5J4YP46_PORPP|nr:hypothetical protein FVE85_3615 [Porphyridium purpureum]|eukprot:POR4335..scf249_10
MESRSTDFACTQRTTQGGLSASDAGELGAVFQAAINIEEIARWPDEDVKFLGLNTERVDDGRAPAFKAQFMAGLREKDSHAHAIIEAALKNHQVRLGIDLEAAYGHTWFYIHVTGVSDASLIKLAHAYGFPRGFCFVSVDEPSHVVGSVGFLPKFSNDERQSAIDANSFRHVTRLEFAEKMSGSLGMLAAIEVNHIAYLFFSAKNSCGKYSREFARLFSEWTRTQSVSLPKLWSALFEENLKVCFEVCYKSGSFGYHGARYKTEFPVAIAIGNPTPRGETLFAWRTAQEAQAFFVEHNLACGPRFVIEDKEAIVPFMLRLNAARDMIDAVQLMHLIQESKAVRVIPGTIDHVQLTTVLEGLVLWIFEDAKARIVKFKFPNYTIMTMLLRPLLTTEKLDKAPTVLPAVSLEGAVLVQVSMAINNFVDRWVVDPSKRDHFRSMAVHILEFVAQMSPETTIDATNYLDLVEPQKQDFQDAPKKVKLDKYLGQHANLLLVVGPVGAGKSTLRKWLQKEFGLPGQGFDECEENFHPRSFKNTKLWGTIAYLIACGQTPVIENGGGAFIGDNDAEATFEQALSRHLLEPVRFQPIILIPDELRQALADNEELDAVLHAFQERTEQVVKMRRDQLGMYQTMDDETLRETFYGANGVTTRNFASMVRMVRLARQSQWQVIGYKRADKGQFGLSEPPRIAPHRPLRATPITYGWNLSYVVEEMPAPIRSKKDQDCDALPQCPIMVTKNVHATMGYNVDRVPDDIERPQFPDDQIPAVCVTFTIKGGQRRGGTGEIIVLPESFPRRRDGITPHCTCFTPIAASRSGRILELDPVNPQLDPEADADLLGISFAETRRPITLTLGDLYAYCLAQNLP